MSEWVRTLWVEDSDPAVRAMEPENCDASTPTKRRAHAARAWEVVRRADVPDVFKVQCRWCKRHAMAEAKKHRDLAKDRAVMEAPSLLPPHLRVEESR